MLGPPGKTPLLRALREVPASRTPHRPESPEELVSGNSEWEADGPRETGS